MIMGQEKKKEVRNKMKHKPGERRNRLAGTIAKSNPIDPYSEIDELSKAPNHGHRKTEI